MAEGYGACLINKPDLVRDMVRLVRNQVAKPNYSTSIKIRYTCLMVIAEYRVYMFYKKNVCACTNRLQFKINLHL
jgi:tRNA-dihydrouridine synthase